MVVEGELPKRQNRRGGAGWWMDLEGVWRSPSEWPEDNPPLEGWVQNGDGTWSPPEAQDEVSEGVQVSVGVLEDSAAPSAAAKALSHQAESDRRAMLSVVGMVGGASLLLAVALVLITQAGASDPSPTEEVAEADVIYAVETDQDRLQRRIEAAENAPAEAQDQLDQLDVRPFDEPDTTTDAVFDPLDWKPRNDGCLDFAENVLVERSVVPITWADQLECVPAAGRWSDRYLGTVMTRTQDAEVSLLVPAAVVYTSGGSTWTAATRLAYVSDNFHPATIQIVSSGAGHNPRSQDPSQWRPSNQDTWCSYAVDWIAVKVRWELDVTAEERDSLAEMLSSCETASSAGADPGTVLVNPLAPVEIEHVAIDG